MPAGDGVAGVRELGSADGRPLAHERLGGGRAERARAQRAAPARRRAAPRAGPAAAAGSPERTAHEDAEPQLLQPAGELRQPAQRRRVGPVDVVDDEHGRRRGRPGWRPATPARARRRASRPRRARLGRLGISTRPASPAAPTVSSLHVGPRCSGANSWRATPQAASCSSGPARALSTVAPCASALRPAAASRLDLPMPAGALDDDHAARPGSHLRRAVGRERPSSASRSSSASRMPRPYAARDARVHPRGERSWSRPRCAARPAGDDRHDHDRHDAPPRPATATCWDARRRSTSACGRRPASGSRPQDGCSTTSSSPGAPAASMRDAGPGETMRHLAQRVGPTGEVVGIDVDAALGAQAMGMLHGAGHRQCSFATVDLERRRADPGRAVRPRLRAPAAPARVRPRRRAAAPVGGGRTGRPPRHPRLRPARRGRAPPTGDDGGVEARRARRVHRRRMRHPHRHAASRCSSREAGSGPPTAPTSPDASRRCGAAGPMLVAVHDSMLPAAVVHGPDDARGCRPLARRLRPRSARPRGSAGLWPLLVGAWKGKAAR